MEKAAGTDDPHRVWTLGQLRLRDYNKGTVEASIGSKQEKEEEEVPKAPEPSLGFLGDLPVELLLKILHYVADDDGDDKTCLFRLLQVAKPFANLVFHPSLWRSLSWEMDENGSTFPVDTLLKTIKEVAAQAGRLGIQGIRNADLVFFEPVDQEFVESLERQTLVEQGLDKSARQMVGSALEAQYYDTLNDSVSKRLAILCETGDEKPLFDYIERCRQDSLKTLRVLETLLKLHGKSLENLTVEDDGTLLRSGNNGAISNRFNVSLPKLKQLDLDFDDRIDEPGTAPKLKLPNLFKLLQRNAPLLEDLRVSIPILTGGDKQAGLDKCTLPSVRLLELSGYDVDSIDHNTTHHTFRLSASLLAHAFPNLTELALLGPWVPISQRRRADAEAIVELLSAFPNLRRLEVNIPGYNSHHNEDINIRYEIRRFFNMLDPHTVPQELESITFHGHVNRREFDEDNTAFAGQASLRTVVDNWWSRWEKALSEQGKDGESAPLEIGFEGPGVTSTGFGKYEFDEEYEESESEDEDVFFEDDYDSEEEEDSNEYDSEDFEDEFGDGSSDYMGEYLNWMDVVHHGGFHGGFHGEFEESEGDDEDDD